MQLLQHATAQDLETLSRLPMFACAFRDELAEIAATARKRTYHRGEVIHHVDDVAGDMFVIVNGHVKHRLLASDGRQITHSVQPPGNSFGTMSVIDGKRRAGDAVALTECEVLVIDRDVIAGYLGRHAAANTALLQRYVASLRRLEGQLHDLAFLSVPMRVAKILLEYAVDEEAPPGIDLVVPAHLNQTELAFLVGTSRESVNQALKQFAAWGWIDSDRRRIHILDARALSRFHTQ